MDIVTYVLAKNSANSATDAAIAALPKGLVYRGAVSYVSDLPDNAEIGDCYTIKYKGTSGTTADGHEVAWGNYEGTPQWIDFGGGSGSELPEVSDSDNGKVLSVVSGEWGKDAPQFIINITYDSTAEKYKFNKTASEINAARSAKKQIILRNEDGYDCALVAFGELMMEDNYTAYVLDFYKQLNGGSFARAFNSTSASGVIYETSSTPFTGAPNALVVNGVYDWGTTTLDKTWQEIRDGNYSFIRVNHQMEDYVDYYPIYYVGHDGTTCVVDAYYPGSGATMRFIAASEDSYPEYTIPAG